MTQDPCYAQPIEIAKDIFWVGCVIPQDSFQCHVYLINNGDESILIDPGSVITFSETIKKISEITQLKNIKYLICHHQDPDITSCISRLEKLINRNDKFIVTHWRAQALLKHYQWETPFWLIDQNDWQLNLKNGRRLRFIFTPYAHFPGAFCTFDETTKTLFSSDLFGGFTKTFSLFAQDENYFEEMKVFHEHYIPSKEILYNALVQIERYNPELIAPQHGSIIKKELIQPMINRLKELECGLFQFGGDSNILKLSKINRVLKGIVDNLALNPRLINALRHIKKLMEELVAVDEFLIVAPLEPERQKLVLFSTNSKASYPIFVEEEQEKFEQLLEMMRKARNISLEKKIEMPRWGLCNKSAIIFPLKTRDHRFIGGAIALLRQNLDSVDTAYLDVFKRFVVPLSVALERELNILAAEEEKEKVYKIAIIDGLTGLFNRFYLNTVIDKEFYKAKRHNYPLSIAIFDIDFFKKVNDTYGHLIGDFILKEIAKIIKKGLRKGDIAIRYGGEEILVVLPFTKRSDAQSVAERIRREVENKEFKVAGLTIKITLSAGVAEVKNEHSINELIKRADENLYRAKYGGRNKVM
ncbi:diguanylate cyclase (GGDEF domain) [Dissulfuribacter thermophilus]|uniref:diguanylate cyclase n=1 Tax=Dissulfuribacter thermophilus TaxID=1156395 RepID=A0A1B9F5J8_9BACT|nr:diguanylate cyclase [Dissulfuribacter thermophilus]OCC15085.1 diguanylate cyclase (GGDEF domain) [Dissulfuribacter thermophilus]